MLALAVRSPAAWTAGYYLMFFMGQPVLVFLAILLFGVYEASAPVHPVHCGCAALFAADARTAGWLAHRPVPALVLGPSAWDGWRPARGWGCFCLAGETFAREEVSAC